MLNGGFLLPLAQEAALVFVSLIANSTAGEYCHLVCLMQSFPLPSTYPQLNSSPGSQQTSRGINVLFVVQCNGASCESCCEKCGLLRRPYGILNVPYLAKSIFDSRALRACCFKLR
jgi:hypothetical protein